MNRAKHPGIYKITHISGSFYIGQSRDITSRWKSHITSFFSGRHSKKMQELWDNSHYSEWTFSIIKFCKIKELDILEKKYIDDALLVTPDLLLNFTGKKKKHQQPNT